MCFVDYVKGISIQETLVNVFLMLHFMVVNMATSYPTCMNSYGNCYYIIP
jgi:hypothetical protein